MSGILNALFWTRLSTPTVEYLVVAGGGGGSYGGGGAGGFRTASGYSVSGGISYSVTVGNGGNGAGANTSQGSDGGNSVFDTITSTGGGGGGANISSSSGRTGGSGGGGGTSTGGAGTAGQGNNGGDFVPGPFGIPIPGGGGGGQRGRGIRRRERVCVKHKREFGYICWRWRRCCSIRRLIKRGWRGRWWCGRESFRIWQWNRWNSQYGRWRWRRDSWSLWRQWRLWHRDYSISRHLSCSFLHNGLPDRDDIGRLSYIYVDDCRVWQHNFLRMR